MRVLCADDEPDIRLVLELALGLDPAIISELVESGEEVLERAFAQQYDLIVLDGSMPGLDGYDTCLRLKADARTAAVPIIFLTANTQRVQRERALECGAIGTITKPFDPMTLAAELRQLSGLHST